MARPRGEIKVTCPNPICKYYHKEEGKDIIKKGKNRAGHQRYLCLRCNTYFVETSDTPLYRKHLSEQEINKICKLLVEKNGIRSIERITGHHRDTIGRLLEDMAEHAEQMNNYLIKNLSLTPLECDELWSTIKKNRKRLSVTAQLSLKKVMHGSTHA
jgi:transposase-like protein